MEEDFTVYLSDKSSRLPPSLPPERYAIDIERHTHRKNYMDSDRLSWIVLESDREGEREGRTERWGGRRRGGSGRGRGRLLQAAREGGRGGGKEEGRARGRERGREGEREGRGGGRGRMGGPGRGDGGAALQIMNNNVIIRTNFDANMK